MAYEYSMRFLMNMLKLSKLSKTWIIDLDGTIFPHNDYMKEKVETPLDGVKDFFERISERDFVIILTSRKSDYRKQTERNLLNTGIRYDILIMDAPTGERILINDLKPSGMVTAYSVCLKRDEGLSKLFFTESDEI